MKLLLSTLLLLLAACTATHPPETLDWKKMSSAQRQAALDKIADECKLARSTFKFRGPDETLFQPDVNANYDSVDCALGKLKTLRGFGKMGFIGNEAYVEENKQ